MFKNWKANNAKRKTFSGEIIEIPKPKDGYLRGQKENPAFLEGKSWQDGEPTPDNPAPINSIPHDTGIVSCGRNIADINQGLNVRLTKSGDIYTMGRPIEGGTGRFSNEIQLNLPPNTEVTMSLDFIENNSTGDTYAFNLIFSDPLVEGSTNAEWNIRHEIGRKELNATFPNGCKYFQFFVRSAVEYGSMAKFKNFQIELGDTATPYTPYQGSTTHLSLIGAPDTEWAGQEIDLLGLPDGTCDYYDQDKNVVVKNCGEKTANGSESGWSLTYNEDIMEDYIRFTNNSFIFDRVFAVGDQYGNTGRYINNAFPQNAAYSGNVLSEGLSFSDSSNVMWIKIAKSRLIGYELSMTNAQKVQLFRDFLSANPVTIQYVCEPYEIPVTYVYDPENPITVPQPKIITVDDAIGTVYNLDGAKMNVNAISYGEEL